MFCANWLISSRVIVTVSVVDGTVPRRLVAGLKEGFNSIGSLLVGDSTKDPAILWVSEVDWKDMELELVSSTMKGLALWLFPFDSLLVIVELAVFVFVFMTPWIFFKCLVRSPIKKIRNYYTRKKRFISQKQQLQSPHKALHIFSPIFGELG